MARSTIRILVILVLAGGAGYIRARDLPWSFNAPAYRQREDKRAWIRKHAGVTLDQFRKLIDQGAVVIDARPAEAYEEGHLSTGYDPPVLNVPPDALDQNIDRLMTLQGMPLVLYCTSITCDYAEDLYMALEPYGFTDMKIYFPGWEGIEKAGLPTASGPDTWTGFVDKIDEQPGSTDSESTAPDSNEP